MAHEKYIAYIACRNCGQKVQVVEKKGVAVPASVKCPYCGCMTDGGK
jgi:uncharacterized Zn finger protein